MAFTLPITLNNEQQAAAYVKATIARCDSSVTVIKLDVWTSQNCRTNSGKPVPSDWLPSDFSDLVQLPTDLNLLNSNPVEYAYKLLEQSGAYPQAIWGV